jgi:hypothetical protein
VMRGAVAAEQVLVHDTRRAGDRRAGVHLAEPYGERSTSAGCPDIERGLTLPAGRDVRSLFPGRGK